MERNLQIDRNHEENLWTRFIKFVGDKSGLQ